MPTVSACMIVLNEEEVLERCLSSLGDFPDQLVIVDTGSTDKTIEIAEKFGAEIYHFKWIDDFAEARNFSFSKATCDYIFWCDGDDEISPEDLQKLKNLKPNLTKDMYLAIYDYFQDEHGNPKCDLWRERIVRNDPGLLFKYPIHECIPMDSIPNLQSEQTDIRITHKRTGAGYAIDHGRNVRMLTKAIKKVKYKDDPRMRYYLAKECQDGGDPKRATREFEKFLKMEDGWWEDRVCARYRLAQSYYETAVQKEDKSGKYRALARAAAKDAIKADPQWAEPYYILGQLAMDEQDFEEAAFWFEKSCKPVPNALSPIHMDYYTWLPHIQLAVCYGQLGNNKKANKHNEIALKYNPDHPSLLHNKQFFADQLKKQSPEGPKKLNLGSGNKRYLDYTSCDLFPGSQVDEVFGLNEIPYEDNTIDAIHSEHALEHLRHVDARQALREWFRVLKPGGEVHLQIPDLEECCKAYVQAVQAGDKRLQEWYMWTLYGVQRSQADEPDEGQIHYTGFNKAELVEELENAGFVIDYIGNYDGWSTPSIEVRVLKPVSNVLITWDEQTSLESPQFRIRTFHIDRWLRGHGYRSKLGQQDGDIVVFGNASSIDSMIKARSAGKKVILNLCEDFETFYSAEQLETEKSRYQIANLVVCCSHVLADKIRKHTPKVVVIEDAVEVDFNLNCTYEKKKQLKVGWIGMGGNAVHAERLRPIIEDELGYELVTIHEHDNATIKWDLNTWQHQLAQCDIAIAPIDESKQPAKSNNKITAYMSLGLPVIASPLDAYVRIIDNEVSGFLAKSDSQWRHYLKLLENVEMREKIGQAGKEKARKFSLDKIGKKWIQALFDGIETVNKMVDIIIPTYNNDDYLQACVTSIEKCTEHPHRIIVVDAANRRDKDNSLMVKFKDSSSTVIYPGRKLNFSEALNMGLRGSKAPFVCFLNDDTIVSKGWLEPLVESAERTGIANPLSNCDRDWLHEYDLEAGGVKLLPGIHQLSDIEPQAIYDFKSPSGKRYERNWIAFFATVMSREVLDKVGQLDEEFETGSEDLDYCTRANKQGYKCAIDERSFVFHFGGVSRKSHEMEDRSKHQEEDTQNQNRISLKYDKPLIVIQTGYAFETWDANVMREKGAGGSETAACRLAEEFAVLGCRSVVFAPTGKDKQIIEGVEWYDSSEWNDFIAMNHISVCIISRYANFLEDNIRCDQLWLHVHDIFAMGCHEENKVKKNYDKITGIFCLSPWHSDFFQRHHDIPGNKIVITGNGADLARFAEKRPALTGDVE